MYPFAPRPIRMHPGDDGTADRAWFSLPTLTAPQHAGDLLGLYGAEATWALRRAPRTSARNLDPARSTRFLRLRRYADG